MISFEDMLGCLAVEALAEDVYTAPNIPLPDRRIFGGQLLAQCIMVASASVPGKSVKSLHAIFPREGDQREPVEYRVQRLHDGRSFSGRSILGLQLGRPIVAASVSLHVREEGLSHQIEAPVVTPPDATPARSLDMLPWQTRVVADVDLESRAAGPPEYRFWMRAPALPDEPALHQALLAHATDLTLIGTSLRPHPGIGQADSPERIRTAVTSHTLWLHRPFRLDDWVLLAQESPVSCGARGFGQGHVFAQGRDLVASFAQESMLRLVDAKA